MHDLPLPPPSDRRRRRTSAAAVAGFVFALMGPLAPLGLAFSIIGMAQTKDGERDGRALAIAGAVIGGLVTAGMLVAFIAYRF